jgi:hypothetical protein
MPQELIFQGANEEFLKQKVVQVHGISVLVQEYEPMRYRIVRVLSSNPNHFLIDSIMPGQTVQYFDKSF